MDQKKKLSNMPGAPESRTTPTVNLDHETPRISVDEAVPPDEVFMGEQGWEPVIPSAARDLANVAKMSPAGGASRISDVTAEANSDTTAAIHANEADLEAALAQDLERLNRASTTISNAPHNGAEALDDVAALELLRADADGQTRHPKTQTHQGVAEPRHSGVESIKPGTSPEDDGVHPPTGPRSENPTGSAPTAGDRRNVTNARRPNPTPKDNQMDGTWPEQLRNPDDLTSGNSTSSDELSASLEKELDLARNELRRIREKASQQTRLQTTVTSQGRMLEQRSNELRNRVAQAQKALDDRAIRIREELLKERARLKAFHNKLQEKSKELVEYTRIQKEKIADDRADIAQREREIDELRSTFGHAKTHELERIKGEFDLTAQMRIDAIQQEAQSRIAAVEKATQARIDAVEKTAQVRIDRMEQQIEDRIAERRMELDSRGVSLDQRELELRRMFEELESVRHEQEAEVQARKQLYDNEAEAQRAAIDEEVNRVKLELMEEAQRREAKLRHVEDCLASREQEMLGKEREIVVLMEKLAEQDTALFEHEKALAQQEAALLDRHEAVKRGDDEMVQLSAALEVRDNRLKEWQSRIESAEAELEAAHQELQNQREAARAEREQVQNEVSIQREAMRAESEAIEREMRLTQETLEEKRAELARAEEESRRIQREIESQSGPMRAAQAEMEESKRVLDTQREVIRARLDELEQQESEIEERTRVLDEVKSEVEFRVKELDEHEAGRFEELNRRGQALEELQAEISIREKTVVAKEEELQSQWTAIERERNDVESLRRRIEAHREDSVRATEQLREQAEIEIATLREESNRELAARREAVDRELSTAQRSLRSHRSEVEAEVENGRREIEQLRNKLDSQAEEIEARERDLTHREESLEEIRAKVDDDRNKYIERRRSLDAEYAELAQIREKQAAKREALSSLHESLAQQMTDLERQKVELESKSTSFTTDSARIERERLAMKDRERTLEDERTGHASARKAADELRRELAARITETEELHRELMSAGERMNARKARLIEQESALESRQRELDIRAEALRKDQTGYQQKSEDVIADAAAIAGERETLQRQRSEFEQARQSYDVQHAKLEEERADLEERQGKLADRAQQLEAFRTRLDGEYAQLQSRKQELIAVQEDRSGAADKLKKLLQQTEQQAEQLKQREGAIMERDLALSTRDRELSKLETEIERETQEVESEAHRLEDERQMFVREREEFELVMNGAVAEAEKRRLEAEERIAAERARLEERERLLQEMASAQREVLEEEGLTREKSRLDEMREEMDSKLTQRLATVSEQEQQTEQRCKSRLDEVEKDVQRRLAQLEAELRTRREQAELEISTRRKALESDLTQARAHLDQLKLRQLALADEKSGSQSSGSPTVKTAEQSFDHLPSFSIGGEGAMSDALTDLGDPEGSAVAINTSELDEEIADLGSTTQAQLSRTMSAAAVVPHAANKRFRPVTTLFCALLIGAIVAACYMWSWSDRISVRGQLALNSSNAAASMSAGDHVAKMISEKQIFATASAAAGMDLAQMYNNRQLEIRPSSAGNQIELAVGTASGNEKIMQDSLAALGRSYEEYLKHATLTEQQRQHALKDASAQLQSVQVERDAAVQKVKQMQAELATKPVTRELESVRAEQEQLKKQAEATANEAEQAKTAYEKFQSTPAPKGAVVPSEADLNQAGADDAALTQALQERATKAQEFHHVLSDAIAKSKAPLASMLSSVETFRSEVQAYITNQTDPDIRRDLEKIATTLSDCLTSGRDFTQEWDRIVPLAASWKQNDDPELLQEYQKKAESLVRDFHAASKQTLGSAIEQADQIARDGTEMTQRKIIQSALAKLRNRCFEARNEWIIAASGVVPANNAELKALRSALTDLTPRIEEAREKHRTALVEKLGKQRDADWAAELERLKNESDAAQGRSQEMNARVMKAMESVVSMDQKAIDSLQETRDAIAHEQDHINQLERKAAERAADVERLRHGGDVNLAGAVTYQPLEPIAPRRFDLSRKGRAFATGAVVAALFTLTIWLLSRPRRAEGVPA